LYTQGFVKKKLIRVCVWISVKEVVLFVSL